MNKALQSRRRQRVLMAVGIYVGLVVTAGVAFSFLRQGVAVDSSVRYVYALLGPALSLFTHMSVFLFALQSLLLLPWLLIGALHVQLRMWLMAGFVICWLGIGWSMSDLF